MVGPQLPEFRAGAIVANDGIEADDIAGDDPVPGKGHHVIDDRCGLDPRFPDVFEDVPHRAVRGEVLEEKVRVPDDASERVVQVVRDPARELPDRFHPARHLEAAFQPAALFLGPPALRHLLFETPVILRQRPVLPLQGTHEIFHLVADRTERADHDAARQGQGHHPVDPVGGRTGEGPGVMIEDQPPRHHAHGDGREDHEAEEGGGGPGPPAEEEGGQDTGA